MRKLSKSIEKYLEAGGWSSSNFFEHAKVLFKDRDINCVAAFEVGRSVIYLRHSAQGKMLKFYVHHNGRSKEFMTITYENGDEYKTFHYSASVNEIKQAILEYFNS